MEFGYILLEFSVTWMIADPVLLSCFTWLTLVPFIATKTLKKYMSVH